MAFPIGIRENLRFLIAEVNSQLGILQRYLSNPSTTLAKRILDRSGYAGNLKMRIHNSCMELFAKGNKGGVSQQILRSVESIATHLERIGEHAREVVQLAAYLSDPGRLPVDDYSPMLDKLVLAIEQIEDAFCDRDSQRALKIGEVEQSLDSTYRVLLKKYTKALKHKGRPTDQISLIFIAHRLEQMGDELMQISEAILSANMGQSFNTDRYYSLNDSVAKLGDQENIDQLVVEPLAETRSGSGIAGIVAADRAGDGFDAIFKDGLKRKVKEERQGVESWHEIYPGLAPKILSYHKRGQSAALLIEHLAGLTFEQILLHEPKKLLNETLGQLTNTLTAVWQETKNKKRVSADYMGQLSKRLGDVYSVHPEFQQMESCVGGLTLPAFDQLLERAVSFESKVETPFSVYIHGDFNVDNIIYDPVERRINFIDLHRSRYMDYVQDVTVFMVSIYRLQVMDSRVRRRILHIAEDFCRFARKYAKKVGDDSFEIRLALGLARSFSTSTRFILDKSLSRAMFLRARYLIEQVLQTDPTTRSDYRVPVKEIFVG